MTLNFQSLGDIVSISKGRKHIPIENGKIRYINIENLHNSANSLFTNESGVHVEEHDLIIAWDGANAGKVGVGFEGVIGSTLARLKIGTKSVLPRYLFWYLESKNDLIKSQRTGATIPHVNGNSLKDLQIPLPPLSIQKRIAEILDAADALRRKDQELLKKYDELAQAIFIDMFGDPVKNEKGWDMKKMGVEFKSIRYGTGSPPQYSVSGIPFLRATNVKGGRIERKGMTFLTETEAKKIAKCIVNEGDLIIVRSGANTGDCAYIDEEYANCLAGYDLIVEMDKVKSRFYNYFLNSIWGKAIIDKLSRRAGQPHLNSEQVSNIECIAPNYSNLEKFKVQIDKIEYLRKISINTKNVNQDLFDSVIQKAFKGELVS